MKYIFVCDSISDDSHCNIDDNSSDTSDDNIDDNADTIL